MATTAEILGLNRPPAITRRWSAYYDRLCAERDRLLARDCSTPITSSAKLDDMTDAGSDEALGDLSLMSVAATKATMAEVLEAIHRIERGTYGICEITGQPIEPARLKAIPWTRCSFAGQGELERNGHAGRARLAGLGTVTPFESVGEEQGNLEAA